MYVYKLFDAAMPTTSPLAAPATVVGTRTYLQIAAPAGRYGRLVSWGFSLAGSTVLTGATNEIELMETDVAATMPSAHVAAGVQPQDANGPASPLTLGTSATGYGAASAEGTIAAVRTFDAQVLEGIAGENNLVYAYQFMPGTEAPVVGNGKFLRVRGTFGDITHNFLTWVTLDL